jgi:hypothetical protein
LYGIQQGFEFGGFRKAERVGTIFNITKNEKERINLNVFNSVFFIGIYPW